MKATQVITRSWPGKAGRFWCAMPLVVGAALLSLTIGASAGGWRGANLQWQYYAYGGAYDGGGSPTECKLRKNNCGSFFTYFNIVGDRKSITFDYSPSGSGSTWAASDLSLPPTIYNGIAINVLSTGTITSVKIDPATNMAGFDTSRISFTAKQIQVDWQNLTFDSSTIVKLDVKFVKTPEHAGRTVTDNPPKLPKPE